MTYVYSGCEGTCFNNESSSDITRLHERQRELAAKRANTDEKITIDAPRPRQIRGKLNLVKLLIYYYSE